MQQILFTVPPEVLREDLLSFLSLKEHVMLDSANCNKKLRQELKIKLEGITFPGNLTTPLGQPGLKWLSARKMSMENILIQKYIPDEVLADCEAAFVQTKQCKFG